MPAPRTELAFVAPEEYARVRSLADPIARARLLAALARIDTLSMIAEAGSGHIGSSFSSLDIVSWLLSAELAGDELYFSSKGHDVPGLYAVLAGLGVLEADRLHTLRRLGGLPGHPDLEVPGIVTNTGSLGMGVSKAKGMARAHRLAGREARIFVLTGDGELQEGQIWESLAGAANQGLWEIHLIVDHNKIQSDTWVESTSSLGDLEARFGAFGWAVGRCDGHDLPALAAQLEAWREERRPKALIADTVKGRGVSFMESLPTGETLYRFHSGAPDAPTWRRAFDELAAAAAQAFEDQDLDAPAFEPRPWPKRPAPPPAERLVSAYAEALVEEGRATPALVALDADLVLDCGLIPFREAFPERFIECGIAEQDMVSQAGGLALRGALPVVHSFACFLTSRANEQIYNNATEGRRIVYVGSLAGLLPGGPGHSHQAVRDLAALRGVPGLKMLEPCCEAETRLALRWAVREATGSTYLRLVSIPCPVSYALPEGHRLVEGRGTVLRRGTAAVVFGYGPVLLPQAFAAADELAARHGLTLQVVSLPWLDDVDGEWLAGAVADFDHIFTLDNHQLDGGQGQLLATRLAELGLAAGRTITRLGLREIPVCGTNEEVLRHHRLDAAGLVASILGQLRR